MNPENRPILATDSRAPLPVNQDLSPVAAVHS